MTDDRIRTSDADRDLVAGQLRDHYAEGRLTRDEFDERLATTLTARTFEDLRQVLTDLPGSRLVPARPGPAPLTAPPPHPAFRYRRRGPRVFPVLMLALLAVLLISGGGAALVAAKIIAIAAAIMFAIFILTVFTAARFVRRVRRHWYQHQLEQRSFYHQASSWPQ